MWNLGAKFQGNSVVWRESVIFFYMKVIFLKETLTFSRKKIISLFQRYLKFVICLQGCIDSIQICCNWMCHKFKLKIIQSPQVRELGINISCLMFSFSQIILQLILCSELSVFLWLLCRFWKEKNSFKCYIDASFKKQFKICCLFRAFSLKPFQKLAFL